LVDDTGTQDEATYFVHNDHLGTPQKITDASQNVVWAGSYEPFGEVSETVATIDNNIRFPGQYEDEESRLHYNYFRDYDPTMGRYIESDPLGLSDGLDTYSYAWQNPLSFIDPEGTAVPIAVGIGIRIVLSQSARKGAARVAGAAVGALFGRGNYTCVVKCNGVQITGPGRGKGVDDCGTDCPETVTGTGAGRTPREAWRNAFRAADRDLPVGCQKRHCRGIGGSCLGWR
ncbi:MAG: RHS repeat-associated core domain-containing protein, partial [Pseudohongiellaceae bacterium]